MKRFFRRLVAFPVLLVLYVAYIFYGDCMYWHIADLFHWTDC